MRYSRVKNELGQICRACLNKKYGIRLKPRNCSYSLYPYVCNHCGEVKNIVEDIGFGKKMLVLFKPFRK